MTALIVNFLFRKRFYFNMTCNFFKKRGMGGGGCHPSLRSFTDFFQEDFISAPAVSFIV